MIAFAILGSAIFDEEPGKTSA
jgi:hypothetical protein